MKTLYACAALAAFQFGFAQKTQELKDFKTITLRGEMELKLVHSNENKLVYESSDEEPQAENEGNNLTISGEGRATLYYKNELEGMVTGSDSKITGADEIKGKSFILTTGSDSQTELAFNVKSLTITAGSDSDIKIKGSAKDMQVTIASDSQVNGKDLTAENITITIGSDGSGVINAKGTVTATVGSDAQLTIYGSPKKVNEIKSDDAQITVVP